MTNDNELEELDRITQAMKESRSQRLPCCLCNQIADGRGVFFPNSLEMSAKLNAPKGKIRVVVYPLCTECMKDPFAHIKAEQVMVRDAAVLRN